MIDHEGLLILAEHENPETAQAIVFDHHLRHIEEHLATKNPKLLNHIQQHVELLRSLDPAIADIRHADIMRRYV